MYKVYIKKITKLNEINELIKRKAISFVSVERKTQYYQANSSS